MTDNSEAARAGAVRVLHDHWDEARGYTYPHRKTYPHQWLWDSCFASVAWAAVGEPERGVRELTNALSAQFAHGFVPHMRYAFPNDERGPRTDCSSFTQPPIFAHAARVLAGHQELDADLIARVRKGLEWLWAERRTPDGLIFLVHPWESGADDSPRWDSWAAAFLHANDWNRLRWRRWRWSRLDRHLVTQAEYDADGAAVGSTSFVAAPAAFNAITAHAAAEYAALTGETAWADRSRELAEVMDRQMWRESEGLWSDVAVVGGGESVHVPTLDGVLGALVTTDAAKATRALDQLADLSRFAAPYGLNFVAREARSYNADQYWRGSAWMQMNYLARVAALRWERTDLVDAIGDMSRRGALKGRYAEHWNPQNGKGHGAIPLTWSAVVAAM
ncbi:hypothetical protein [Sporichthya sp.]|uniref:MGH1-like glycoside hydrolase domain-containing protein n=1 Tax=Sporichthya sp. TaxID=65475 RepID=UPI0025E39040|nr:hypothetical protein [Sporichthya sp.]